jgi:hypothetical protein
MSNAARVITTTTNTVVDSANTAVSIGRWSNLAIIASSFRSAFPFPHLITSLGRFPPDDTSFLPLVLISALFKCFACSYMSWISIAGREADMLTLVAPLSQEVGASFPTCSGNFPQGIYPSSRNRAEKIEVSPIPYEGPYAPSLWTQGVTRSLEGSNEPRGSYREILGVLGPMWTRGAGDDFDTTPDTTQGATRSHGA